MTAERAGLQRQASLSPRRMRIGCVGGNLPWAMRIKTWLESWARKFTELSHTNHVRTNQTTQSNLQP